MFIPDPNFHPGSRAKKNSDPGFGSGSAPKNLSIFYPKTVSMLVEKLSEMFIPDPDFFPSRIPVPDPGSRGQKGIRSRIRIRNTGFNPKSFHGKSKTKLIAYFAPKSFEFFNFLNLSSS
jgi:hypothetical protein